MTDPDNLLDIPPFLRREVVPTVPGQQETKRELTLPASAKLYEERRRRRNGTLFKQDIEPRRLPGRGSSMDRFLWSVEAYRRRHEGELWKKITRDLGKGPTTVRKAVSDLCERTGLPYPDPKKQTVLPDAPETDCDACPKRLANSQGVT